MTKGDKTTKTKSSELDIKDLDKVAGGGRKEIPLAFFEAGFPDATERHHIANPAPTADLPGEAPGAVEPDSMLGKQGDMTSFEHDNAGYTPYEGEWRPVSEKGDALEKPTEANLLDADWIPLTTVQGSEKGDELSKLTPDVEKLDGEK